MTCTQFSCAPDHAVRIPRWPGTSFNFFKFGREQPEFAGAIKDKFLGYIGLAAEVLQVQNQHIPHADILAAPRVSSWSVGACSFCHQRRTKKSAKYPAQMDSAVHVAIIASNLRWCLSTLCGAGR
jgi:hypothetical protein